MNPDQEPKSRDSSIMIASPRSGDTIGQSFVVCGTFDPAGTKAPKVMGRILDKQAAEIAGEAEFECKIIDPTAKVWLGSHTTANELDGEFVLSARLYGKGAAAIATTSVRPIFRKTPVATLTAPDPGSTHSAANILVTVTFRDPAHTFTDVTLQLEDGMGIAEGKSKTLVAVGLPTVGDKMASTTIGSHFRVTAVVSDGTPANDVNLSAGELTLT